MQKASEWSIQVTMGFPIQCFGHKVAITEGNPKNTTNLGS